MYLGGARPARLSFGMARGAVGIGWTVEMVNIPLHLREAAVYTHTDTHIHITQCDTHPHTDTRTHTHTHTHTHLPTGSAMVRWHTAKRWPSCSSMNSWSLKQQQGRREGGGGKHYSSCSLQQHQHNHVHITATVLGLHHTTRPLQTLSPDLRFLCEGDPHWPGGLEESAHLSQTQVLWEPELQDLGIEYSVRSHSYAFRFPHYLLFCVHPIITVFGILRKTQD